MGWTTPISLAFVLVVLALHGSFGEDCANRLDIIFVLDGSQSITNVNWEKIKSAVAQFITETNTKAPQARFGVVVYSSGVRPEGILEITLPNNIINRVRNLAYPELGTDTHTGIKEAMNMFTRNNVAGVPKIMIVITDGISRLPDETKTAADTARAQGINVFAAGVFTMFSSVARRRFVEELTAIAGTAEQFTQLDDFTTLTETVLGFLTKVCSGSSTGTRVDGQWSLWSRQTVDTCGSDCQRRVTLVRTCTNPAPANGGSQCVGSSTSTTRESCTGGNCVAVNGQWSSWTRGTVFSCGSDCKRSVSLSRTCTNPTPANGGSDCSGVSTTTIREDCTGGGCVVVNGQWSFWTRQTVDTCGSDCRRRVTLVRTCTNPAPANGGDQCVGSSTNSIVENCQGGNCVVVNGQWSLWTRQTVDTCGSDCRRRVTLVRTCTNPAPANGGAQCVGSSTNSIVENCQGGNCQGVNGQWSSWTRGTEFSCGSDCKRSVSLSRTCTNPAPANGGSDCSGISTTTIREDCTGGSCVVVNGQWAAWSRQTVGKCGSNCKRTVTLVRTCTNPSPANGGAQCAGISSTSTTESCTGDSCVRVDGEWAAWIRVTVGTCSSSCKRNVERRRTCTNPAPSNGGAQCVGVTTDTLQETCSGGNCVGAVDGAWSQWVRSTVGKCSSTCKRTVGRTRTCTNPAPSNGGQSCSGDAADTILESCTGDDCVTSDCPFDVLFVVDESEIMRSSVYAKNGKTAFKQVNDQIAAYLQAIVNVKDPGIVKAGYITIGMDFSGRAAAKVAISLNTDLNAFVTAMQAIIRQDIALRWSQIIKSLPNLIPKGSKVIIITASGVDTNDRASTSSVMSQIDAGFFVIGLPFKQHKALTTAELSPLVTDTLNIRSITVDSFKNTDNAIRTELETFIPVVCPKSVTAVCNNKMDVVVVVDGSFSIQKATFDGVLRTTLLGLTDQLFALGRDLRIGMVLFSHLLDDTVGLTSSIADFKDSINKLVYPDGGTSTYLGIEAAREIFSKNDRTDATKLMLIITDGESDNTAKTIREAALAKAAGITIYAVGVGSGSSTNEIRKIASSSSHVLTASNYDELAKQLKEITSLCAVDGGWSDWKFLRFGDCSVTCASGTKQQYETRTCTNPKPKNGGEDCGADDKRNFPINCNTNVLCPVWSLWSGYKETVGCSVTCGSNGVHTLQRSRTCINDIPAGNGCGAKSPQVENKQEACSSPVSCAYWSTWSAYQYGSCSKTCGTATQTGTRTRTCVNDNASKRLCGKLSPDTEQTSRSCTTLPPCPFWGAWSNYVDISQCSVTCGSGTKNTQRTRVCQNDITSRRGCGDLSPQRQTKQEQCFGSACPYWAEWSTYTYGSCSKTCGTATQSGTRSRTCVNDDSTKRLCGKLAPDIESNTRSCTTLPACPSWGAWSSYVDITVCSVTCGTGTKRTQRRRICQNDAVGGNGCGAASPQLENKDVSCKKADCPYWGPWTVYQYGSCSATCGTAFQTGTRQRTCVNDNASRLLCGKLSPEKEQNTRSCTNLPSCPQWGAWTGYTDVTGCSVTCGTGTKTTRRSRTCVNDVTGGNGCGAKSPQLDNKQVQCFGSACPVWSAWTVYKYGDCSKTCGTGATQTGQRSRTCLNDDSTKRRCGKLSPDFESTTRGCTLPSCPIWGAWSAYSDISKCSQTCGTGSSKTMQRSRVCTNDVSGVGCGAQSPQRENVNVACTLPACPAWGAWSAYSFGKCSATCGSSVKTGVRSRSCNNDDSTRLLCGAPSPDQEKTTRICTVPSCPQWGLWSKYSDTTSCSVTCGSGTKMTQRQRVCNNDVQGGTGCGAKSPQAENKEAQCFRSACPTWGYWSNYVYGSCSATCGSGGSKVGVRSRICLNDDSTKRLCGKPSPDQEQQTQSCTLQSCPSWSEWSGYSAVTACSVTCGANGVWTTRSTRVCLNDVASQTGCGKKSPDVRTKQESCSSPTTCPYWSTWSGYTYSSCSATCGAGITRTASRSRACLNDVDSGRGCGAKSPQIDQQTQKCTVPACPFWGAWTAFKQITPCSKTCGRDGVLTVQRSRVCNNDVPERTGCGSLSPDKESKSQPCSTTVNCPVWGGWTGYAYGPCSATCGSGVTKSGSRTRTCINDNANKMGCGAKSPESQTQLMECKLTACPVWSIWSAFTAIGPCSVTCGAGGTWTTRRSRTCINDNSKHTACGASSPQAETKSDSCSSPVSCPFWSSWSGYQYGACSATCGKGVTRNGQRSRICRNDVSTKDGCGARSPQMYSESKACAVPLCPTWGVWSTYTAITPCSVTCGSGGTWKLQRTQKCDNDIPSSMGCGSKAPKVETKTESCSSNTQCPAWGAWSGFTYSPCSATCGTGLTKIATRSRTCSNDFTGFECGKKSPDVERQRQGCASVACPSWAQWTSYAPTESCSVTCGLNGVWNTRRTRTCVNDNSKKNGCGATSPQQENRLQGCPATPKSCPVWGTWSRYSYSGCSTTCGSGTKTATRSRSCINDVSTKDGCGAKSPQVQSINEACSGSVCPAWSMWTGFNPIGPCSVTCGTGGSWRTQRTRVCNNDNSNHNGCGSSSPQSEIKTASCTSPVTCPYWGAWSGFSYGRCSATCGTGITRLGQRTRICRNDVKNKDGCGASSPQTENQQQACRVPLCPSWGTWSSYSAITPCSVTCGGTGTQTLQRKMICNNDIASAMGCGSKSPKTETKTESCAPQESCPIWGGWSNYKYGPCSPACGTSSTQTGIRTRTCLYDIKSKLGCGAKSPQSESDLKSCTVPACPKWGQWSAYQSTKCSVTCGSGGSLTQQRTRSCQNDNTNHNGCGATSPQVETKTQSCTSPITCPYWGSWSGFTYGGCSATCGNGVSRTGQRYRYCIGDTANNPNACGAKSPQLDQQQKACKVPACPVWGTWTVFAVTSPCTVTCGTNGLITTRRRRVCLNDVPTANGCGSQSPEEETKRTACSNLPNCPAWSEWSLYTYAPCSATCGPSLITSGSRSRTCVNDNGNKLACGAKSPEVQKGIRDCNLSPCPTWGIWSTFTPIDSCSVTCGSGGTWTTRRTRTCINDNAKKNGCGANSPQSETKKASCSSGRNCPFWSSWSGFKYGQCSSTCGTKITRIGERSRVCRNDVSGNDCGSRSPQTDRQPQACSVPACPTWAAWTSYAPIEACSVTCGSNGVWRVRRERQCINDLPSRMGCGALAPQRESKQDSCTTNVACPVWGAWTNYIPATACSVTCRGSNGVQTFRRSRTCQNDVTGGGGCGSGVSQESVVRSCTSNVGCPVDGQWGPWKKGAIGPCSVTCGTGTTTRTLNRACDSPTPLSNGRDCVVINGIGATMTESEKCTMVDCPRPPVGLCDSVQIVNEVGYRLHPTDCDKYVQCYTRQKDNFKVGVIHTCPFDHYWDQKQLRCDLACKVDCPLEKCKGNTISTHNKEGSCRAYWACTNGKSEAMCCPAGFAYVFNRGCQVDFTCRDKCPTICANKDVCLRRPEWENTNKFQFSLGKAGWTTSTCPKSTLYFDIIDCVCSTAATQTCAPDFVMDFSNPNVNSVAGIAITKTNVGISGGVARFTGSSRIRAALELTEASPTKPVAVVFQYKEAAVVTSRQILITSPQCKNAKSASMVFAVEMDTFVVEVTNWYGSRTRMEIPTDGFPVDSWKKVTFLYDGKFITTTVEVGKRKYSQKDYAPQVGLVQCGLDMGTLGSSYGYVGQLDTVGIFRCDPSIPVY